MTTQALPPQEAIERLLGSMSQLGASDLHLKVGYAPHYRIAGQLRKVDMPPIADTPFLVQMLENLVPQVHREALRSATDLDCAARLPSGERYRINLFRAMGELQISIRRVQNVIPSFEQLHLPDVYRKSLEHTFDGLLLVSGVTGAGKSTTLAAMVEFINQHRQWHIITIEDPVEFAFKPKRSIISQREIGIDVPDYPQALRYVVRQDPNCILIGEMRDHETMLAGLQAAETGHLVLGSLHCSDVQQTFSRVLEFFPRPQHPLIRAALANSLKGVFCQKLVPGIEENTRFPATEVLLNNMVVKDKIVHEAEKDLPAIIAQNREDGMRSFTTSLCELVEQEKVHYDTAMDFAPNREILASAVTGIHTETQSLVGRVRKEG